jgi:hypothetical protein
MNKANKSQTGANREIEKNQQTQKLALCKDQWP